VTNRGGKGGKCVMHLYTKECTYRGKEREERAEEYHPSVACAPPSVAGRGRGES
jgi:hypothetical protein